MRTTDETCKGCCQPMNSTKIHSLLDWSPNPRDIADPWYTGDFDETYRDVVEGCGELLKLLGGK